MAWLYDYIDQRFYRVDVDAVDRNLVFLSGTQPPILHGLAGDGGNLWGSSGGSLYSINTTTGVGTLVGSHGLSLPDVQAFTAVNGVLYLHVRVGGIPNLYTVNKTTGAATLIGEIMPDSLSLRSFAQIDNQIYGVSSGDVYRTVGGIGNRWEVLFPDDTTEVDGADTTLKLFTEEDGDEIALIRNADIADAVAFASSYDGATAHTISVGDNLDMALYKDDDTPLFQGSQEAFYENVPLVSPTFTTRGTLIATSSTLPTAADSDELTSITWTLGDDAPGGFVSSGSRIRVPQLKPSNNVNGFEGVALVDGVEVDQVNFPWGPGSVALDQISDEESYNTLQFQVGDKIDITYEQDDSNDYGELWIEGDSDVLPADATVKIYLSGVFVV